MWKTLLESVSSKYYSRTRRLLFEYSPSTWLAWYSDDTWFLPSIQYPNEYLVPKINRAHINENTHSHHCAHAATYTYIHTGTYTMYMYTRRETMFFLVLKAAHHNHKYKHNKKYTLYAHTCTYSPKFLRMSLHSSLNSLDLHKYVLACRSTKLSYII